MGRKKITDEKDIIWQLRMKVSFKQKFQEFCDKNGYSISKRMRTLIERDMNGEQLK